MRESLCGHGPSARVAKRWSLGLLGLAGLWCGAAAADPFASDALARIKSQDAAGAGGISIGHDGFASGSGGTGRAAAFGNVLVLGTPFDDSTETTWSDGDATANSGAVYVIRAPGGDWANYVIDGFMKESSATGAAIAGGNYFGLQVAFDGATLAVSAPRSAAGAYGKVYVYRLTDAAATGTSNVSSQASFAWKDTLTDSSAVGLVNRQYGFSLAIHGRNLFVGVPKDNANNESTGTDNNYSVKVKGTTTNTYKSGAVYVYYDDSLNGDGSGYPLNIPNKKLKHRTDVNGVAATSGAEFGWSIAHDGAALLVGQPFAGTANAATVYVSSNPTNPANWASGTIVAKNLQRTAAPGFATDTEGERYGFAVAIEGATAVVGAPYESSSLETANNIASNNSGAAYLFHSGKGNANWSSVSLVKRLKAMTTDAGVAPDPTYGAEFGVSVALKGSHLVVGARQYDPTALVNTPGNQSASGAVYAFEVPSPETISVTADDVAFIQKLDYQINGSGYIGKGGLNCTTLCDGDMFGSNVTLDDSSGTLRLFVTAPGESSSAWNMFDNPQPKGSVGYFSGAAFVFGLVGQ